MTATSSSSRGSWGCWRATPPCRWVSVPTGWGSEDSSAPVSPTHAAPHPTEAGDQLAPSPQQHWDERDAHGQPTPPLSPQVGGPQPFSAPSPGEQGCAPADVPRSPPAWRLRAGLPGSFTPCLGTEEGAGSPAALTDTTCLWEESRGDTLPDGTPLWASPIEVCGGWTGLRGSQQGFWGLPRDPRSHQGS